MSVEFKCSVSFDLIFAFQHFSLHLTFTIYVNMFKSIAFVSAVTIFMFDKSWLESRPTLTIHCDHFFNFTSFWSNTNISICRQGFERSIPVYFSLL